MNLFDERLEQPSPLEVSEEVNGKMGSRYNGGKPQISMVLDAGHAVEGAAKVLGFGAAKYARGNWLDGLSHMQIVDSLMRHLIAYTGGEDVDPESGLRHVDHITCNALFLGQMTAVRPDLDDRSLT